MAKKKGESSSDTAGASARAATTDPMQLWRDWIDRTERHWNSTLNELTTSESFSQAQSRFFDSMLALQGQMNSATERYFSIINLPSRTDVLSLGNQLASIEERLVDLEGKIQQLSARLPGDEQPAAPPRPVLRRTRKAPRSPRDETLKTEPPTPEKESPKKSPKKSKKKPKKNAQKKARKKASKPKADATKTGSKGKSS